MSDKSKGIINKQNYQVNQKIHPDKDRSFQKILFVIYLMMDFDNIMYNYISLDQNSLSMYDDKFNNSRFELFKKHRKTR